MRMASEGKGASEEKMERAIVEVCVRARTAARALGPRERAVKDRALHELARGLVDGRGRILAENAKDLEDARARGTSGAMLDRLALDEARLRAMARAAEEIAELH